MRWAGHVARMMKKRECRVLVRKHDKKPLLIYVDVNVRLILKCVLKKEMEMNWIYLPQDIINWRALLNIK
jgi:hypothetical protein